MTEMQKSAEKLSDTTQTSDFSAPNSEDCKSEFKSKNMKGGPYSPKDRDARIDEVVEFSMLITVANTSGVPWFNNIVKDNFGGQLDVTSCDNTGDGDNINVSLVTVGNSDKVKLVWTIGTLTNGQTATLDCTIVTDTDPGGNQSYTECGEQEFNSGANLKFKVGDPPKKRSFETGPINHNVPCDF